MIEEIIFKQEPLIRTGFFFGMLGVMGIRERLFPTRRPVVPKPLRWAGNLGMVVFNTLLLRAVFPPEIHSLNHHPVLWAESGYIPLPNGQRG